MLEHHNTFSPLLLKNDKYRQYIIQYTLLNLILSCFYRKYNTVVIVRYDCLHKSESCNCVRKSESCNCVRKSESCNCVRKSESSLSNFLGGKLAGVDSVHKSKIFFIKLLNLFTKTLQFFIIKFILFC